MLETMAAAQGHLLPWAPVCLSFGIGGYFALLIEPPPAGLWIVAGGVGLLLLIALRGPALIRVPAVGIGLIGAGLLLAALRSHSVAAPVLAFRYYGPVEGRIVAMDRSFSDQLRLTLDRVVLKDVPPDRTPERVRVALHGEHEGVLPEPGLTVILTAHLSPPEGPVEPGGFDFQRLAWFARLGGVGYTRAPVLALEPPEGGMSLMAFRLRMTLSRAIQDHIGGQPGAFAAALMTGDRSGVEAATTEALRGSNLSHLIAISGLHMGLLTGFVFAACRYGLALLPSISLRLNSKKFAAIVALAAAIVYLMLAGPSVATRRAFIMAAVMLTAVLADRRAISLRSVAIAALIVLVIEPESLVEPGFQMSFSATVALISVYQVWTRVQHRVPPLLRPAAMLLVSSAAAGLATAPIAAAHFNRIAEYGLAANLLAVPLMGLVVMPMGVVAAVLSLVGLAGPALWVMGQGTALILAVAHGVASLDGAVAAVSTPPAIALPLIAVGGLAMFIGRAVWLRGVGVAILAAALLIWGGAGRPDLLIAGDGGFMGVMGPEGRALSKKRGSGFVAQSWLEDDGDMAGQEEAAQRPGLTERQGGLATTLGGRTILIFRGKAAQAVAAPACQDGNILILPVRWEGSRPATCEIFDLTRLRETGALALYEGGSGLRLVAARDISGRRLWNDVSRLRQDKSRYAAR